MIIRFLHQYLLYGVDFPAANLGRDRLHFFEKTVKPLLYHIFRNLILHGGGRRAGTFGVDKGEGAVIADSLNHVHGFLKIFLRLPRKTDNNIGGQGYIRYRLFNFRGQRQILFFCILPIHQIQYSAAARLKREVQMAANLA